MRILFLTQMIPFPKNSGGNIISFDLLHHLSKYHEIHFASFVDSVEDDWYKSKLLKYCKTIYTEFRSIIYQKHRLSQLLIFFLSVISNKSYIVSKFHSLKMNEYIATLIKSKQIDLIIIVHSPMMQYIPIWFDKEIIYINIDIMSSIYHQYAAYEINIIKKMLYLLESNKLLRYEKESLKKVTSVWSISNDDIKDLVKICSERVTIKFIPIPFKTKYLYQKNSKKTILFVGSLYWKPNYDGIKWFLKKIYPEILNKIPDCKLLIAGQGVKRLFQNRFCLVHRSIKLFPNITQNSKELISLYKYSSVSIVPILFGSGIRIKILDALSHGVPIVTTREGAKGIKLKNNCNALISDNKDQFVQDVIRILSSEKLALKLSKNGYYFVKKYYNYQKVERILKNISSCTVN